MQENTASNSNELLEKLNRLMFDYYFSLSTKAASKGDYALAGSYISELLKSDGEIPVLLDLQAKIAAQQGKFKEAEFLWKKCLKTEPDNVSYISALNRVNKLLSSKAFRFYGILRLLSVLVIILLLTILFFVFIRERKEIRDRLASLSGKHDSTILRIDNGQAPQISKNELLPDINNKISVVKGIHVDKTNDELSVVFENGLFYSGIKIKPDQVSTVLQLAKMLESYAGKIVIKIIGSTDDIPVATGKFKNNNSLSIARANVIYGLVYENSRIPNEDLEIGSLSEVNHIFSNDNSENRLKNRSVIIKIVQK